MIKRLAAALLLATAAPAAAEPFTLVIYESPQDLAARSDPERAPAYWASYAAFGEALAKEGAMIGGGAVETAATGGLVGRPAAEPLSYSGHFVIEAADLAAAVRWAERLPAARTGRVEVRRNVQMMAGSPPPR
jgi:hypothetical protein